VALRQERLQGAQRCGTGRLWAAAWEVAVEGAVSWSECAQVGGNI